MFGGIFHDYFENSWEVARGYLREELEQLRTALENQWALLFNRDGTLTGLAVSGNVNDVPRYVANTGPVNVHTGVPTPKWDKVDLLNGVKSRLQFEHFIAATQGSVLVGRESGSAGDFEEITLGSGLSMTGTVLSSTGSGGSIDEAFFLGGL